MCVCGHNLDCSRWSQKKEMFKRKGETSNSTMAEQKANVAKRSAASLISTELILCCEAGSEESKNNRIRFFKIGCAIRIDMIVNFKDLTHFFPY